LKKVAIQLMKIQHVSGDDVIEYQTDITSLFGVPPLDLGFLQDYVDREVAVLWFCHSSILVFTW